MQNQIHLFLKYHHAEQTETPRFNAQPLSSCRCNCLLCRVTRSCHWLLYYSWKQYLALMNLPLTVEGKTCICICKGGSGAGSQQRSAAHWQPQATPGCCGRCGSEQWEGWDHRSPEALDLPLQLSSVPTAGRNDTSLNSLHRKRIWIKLKSLRC